MNTRIEQAVEEGLQIAQACGAQPNDAMAPSAIPESRPAALTRLAARYVPVVMAVLVAGSAPEIINIVWGPA